MRLLAIYDNAIHTMLEAHSVAAVRTTVRIAVTARWICPKLSKWLVNMKIILFEEILKHCCLRSDVPLNGRLGTPRTSLMGSHLHFKNFVVSVCMVNLILEIDENMSLTKIFNFTFARKPLTIEVTRNGIKKSSCYIPLYYKFKCK